MGGLLLAALLASAAPAAGKLSIVATTPDLADLARRVGGDLVQVESLTRGHEDIHAVPMRPSFVPKLNRADALVSLGLGAEHAFLPGLLEVAQNPRILPGAPGSIEVSEGIKPLDVPAALTRAEGEQHPDGNPHFNLDPRNGPLQAAAIARGLSRVDPPNAARYEAGAAAFAKEASARLEGWRKLAAPLKGRKAVSQHRDMVYLADFTGLRMIGEVEPKPGIAPAPRHLEALAERMKAEGVGLIIREAHFPAGQARWLAQRTGARTAVVSVMGGTFPDSGDWFGFIEHNLKALAEAAP